MKSLANLLFLLGVQLIYFIKLSKLPPMYPLTLIRFSNKHNISLELKDGHSITGRLVKCDVAMNMHLTNATISKADGTEFFARVCFLRGQNVRMVKIQPWVMSKQHLFN